jgi:hypothetical protein
MMIVGDSHAGKVRWGSTRRAVLRGNRLLKQQHIGRTQQHRRSANRNCGIFSGDSAGMASPEGGHQAPGPGHWSELQIRQILV